MPSITFSYKDLCNLIGRHVEIEKIAELLEYAKAELDSYDEQTDEIAITLGDTNLPYLWSVEGIARLFKGLLNIQTGIPAIEIFKKSEYKLNVNESVKEIRPYIAAFVAKGCKIDNYLIKQMISLQEKLCDNYGRRRQKVAVGIYNCNKLSFPVTYKATDPDSIKFTPLEFKKQMTQKEIVEEHPTGQKFAWILEGMNKYPIIVDANESVLSFPPIINSDWSGRINIGDEDLFFEATGTDLDSVLTSANIFAQAFYERGFKIFAVDIHYPEGQKITTPFLFNESIKISPLQVRTLLGLDLDEERIGLLLATMRYEYKNGKVRIPDYRRDIMHTVDVMEDIAIAYGYNNIEISHLKTLTTGKTFPIIPFIDNIRELAAGFGYQEVMSSILCSKEEIYSKMNASDLGTIEIKEFISERFSAVRTWILPILMQVLSENKHVDYPQKIFEEGFVTKKNNSQINDYHNIALVTAHGESNYTEIRQVLDSIMKSMGIEFSLKEEDIPTFIPGRAALIYVNGKTVGFLGEIAPEIISNFGLNVPVAGMEINLSEIFTFS